MNKQRYMQLKYFILFAYQTPEKVKSYHKPQFSCEDKIICPSVYQNPYHEFHLFKPLIIMLHLKQINLD